MNKTNLHSYSIMALDTAFIEEICNDIKEQYTSGVCACPLFQMTLVPEGNPPVNKALTLCEKYKLFKARLDEMGIPSGILVQASVGHGWVLGEMFPYQSHVNFTDGVATRCCCPLDDGFKEYIYNALRTIASYNPAHIMIDDDFRTIWFKGEGCACPLHMKLFNEMAGASLTDRELWNIVNEKTELAKRYTDIFIEAQRISLVETARVMRAGIDSVNPSIPGSYCCCGNNGEFADEIASVLAGEGNPVVVRINNGNYTPVGPRNFSRAFHRAATQIAKLKGKVDVFLAETDTCPQNRYSTSASSLHTHFTGTILEGANGAKHWITRLVTYEPESGVAYRNYLSRHTGFYNKLAELHPKIKWRGCRIFTPNTPDFTYGRVKEEWDSWSNCVLERLGIPMYFAPDGGSLVCLEGDSDSRLSDEEILEILKGSVMLASDTAKNLISRGFGKYLGVDVKEWQGKTPIVEILNVNNKKTKVQVNTMELIPLSKDVIVDSWVCNTVDYTNYQRLFPGSTIFKNELGGYAFVFCGTPAAEFHITTAFSFLTYSRKLQLLNMVRLAGELPVYFPGDEEVYLKVGELNGGYIATIFNISLDPIENVALCCDFEPARFTALCENGDVREISFKRDNENFILDIPANPLNPVIIFIEK